MSTVQIQGTTLEYLERGIGEPLVLVHGTLGDFRSWYLQMAAFPSKYRTISYSRRYHYPNSCQGNESDYSASLHADDLADFIVGLGLESAFVVGTSYGAYTALLLAARHPERVRAMVLGDPPVFPMVEDHPEGSKVVNEFLETVWEPAAELMHEGKTEQGVRVFVDGVVEEGAFDQFPPEVQKLLMENACEFGVETSSTDFWTPFTCREAARIDTPALLLTGDRSLPLFRLIVDELGRCMPGGRIEIVPETTHEVTSDNPDAFNKLVMDFLETHTT